MPPEHKGDVNTPPERSAGSGQSPEGQLPDGVPAQGHLLPAQQGPAGQPCGSSPMQAQQAGRLGAPGDMTEPGEAEIVLAGGSSEGMEAQPMQPMQLEQPAEQAIPCPAPAEAQASEQVRN